MTGTAAPNTAREKLWAKETADSWNISTRVLLMVGLKGSFFDERNPRLALLRKLETVIEHEDLKAIEAAGSKTRNAGELRTVAEDYNRRYRELFLKSFEAGELRTLAIDGNCALIPSRELEASVRH